MYASQKKYSMKRKKENINWQHSSTGLTPTARQAC
jgi:hypothetical protein